MSGFRAQNLAYDGTLLNSLGGILIDGGNFPQSVENVIRLVNNGLSPQVKLKSESQRIV